MDDQAAQALSGQQNPAPQQAIPPVPQAVPQPEPQVAQPIQPAPQASPLVQPQQMVVPPVQPQPVQPQPLQSQPLPATDVSALTSVLPQATQAAVQAQLNPVGATSSLKKEAATSGLDTLGALAQEVPGAQSVEQERTPEISPEVESWMESVDRREERQPEKVVVADQTAQAPTGNYAAEPVIVLPLTQTNLQQGMKHNVTDSVKWLAVWCMRIIKKFHGAVVYRPVETTETK